jgi:hypothetical protein
MTQTLARRNMNTTISNTGSILENVKSNVQAGSRSIKDGAQKTFAQVQAMQSDVDAVGAPANRVGSFSTANETQVSSESGVESTDQLLIQIRMAIAQSDDPKAGSDSSRTSQQSATITTGSAPAATIAAFQAEDQLLLQGRNAIQQSEDPKWTADGSKVSVQSTNASASVGSSVQSSSSRPNATSAVAPEERTINIDRSASHGIVDGMVSQMTNQKNSSQVDKDESMSEFALEKMAMDQTFAAFRMNANANSGKGDNMGSMNMLDSRYASTWGSSVAQNGAAMTMGTGTVIDYTA